LSDFKDFSKLEISRQTLRKYLNFMKIHPELFRAGKHVGRGTQT